MIQCENNNDDRELGKYWERQFCLMAYDRGMVFTPHQWNREKSAMAYGGKLNKYTLPDITVWSCPGEHHEIKHKNPTKKNSIGFEKYRYEALREFMFITNQKVFYTIHNHDLSGGRYGKENKIEHWFTAEIENDININNAFKCIGCSYVSGEKKQVDVLYWDIKYFHRLLDIWKEQGRLFPAHVV